MTLQPLTPARQRLAVKYMPLAFRLSRRYERGRPDLTDDLRSAAQWGLVQAASTYQQNGKFGTLAWACIERRLLDVLRVANLRCRRERTPFPPRLQRSVEQHLMDCDEAQRILRRLPVRQRKVMELTVMDDINDRDVAAILGISVQSVWKDRAAAIDRLR